MLPRSSYLTDSPPLPGAPSALLLPPSPPAATNADTSAADDAYGVVQATQSHCGPRYLSRTAPRHTSGSGGQLAGVAQGQKPLAGMMRCHALPSARRTSQCPAWPRAPPGRYGEE